MVATAPAQPRTIEETGLDSGLLLNLLVKNVYRLGHETPTAMGAELKLPTTIIDQLIDMAREGKLLQPMGVRSASVAAEMRFELSDAGRVWALDALRQSEYVGPAPVPIELYRKQVARQSIRTETITRDRLYSVMKDLTLPEMVAQAVGPAANSASSMLLYGPPGNGKSSIAYAICEAFRDVVFIPHALELDRQIITMFDSTVHREVKLNEKGDGLRRAVTYDRRFVVCKRPVIITGGELTIDMLDLSFNATTQIYEAPLQLKAAGGVFVIDDFGRQREQPQALINRWIIPMERGIDYLTLQTGRKFEAPFDTLVIFSTNIPPRQLVDDAALRRIRHKIEIGRPDQDAFIRILIEACRSRGVGIDEDTIAFLLRDMYAQKKEDYAAFHPGFLIDQVLSIAAYEGAPKQMTPDYIKRAWGNLFTTA
ncbi:MAG: ATPase [Pseudomonadota bacterium]